MVIMESHDEVNDRASTRCSRSPRSRATPVSAATVRRVGAGGGRGRAGRGAGGVRGAPALDPPADALAETVESIAAALAAHGGLLAVDDDEPVGALVLDPDGDTLFLRRVGVVPYARHHGVAAALLGAALEAARRLPAASPCWPGEELPAHGPLLAATRGSPRSPRRRAVRPARAARPHGVRRARRRRHARPRPSPRAALGAGRPGRARGRARRRQDDASPRASARGSASAAGSPRRRS